MLPQSSNRHVVRGTRGGLSAAVVGDLGGGDLVVPEQLLDLSNVLAGLHRAVAVHGYDREESQAEALRRDVVAVYRRLRPRAFRFLRPAVCTARAATALGRHPQDRQATGQAGSVA